MHNLRKCTGVLPNNPLKKTIVLFLELNLIGNIFYELLNVALSKIKYILLKILIKIYLWKIK